MEWMLMPYRKLYRLIEGRSGRREFWMFTLFVWITMIAAAALLIALAGTSTASVENSLESMTFGTRMAGAGIGALAIFVVLYAWALLTGVASFAVTVRRLHDLNLSGWFLLLFYVLMIGAGLVHSALPFVGAVGWIVVMALPGTTSANKYDTIDPSQAEVFA